MENKRYWFPVRPARNGWGWGLPMVWQGWAVLILFFVFLAGGMSLLAFYRPILAIPYALALTGLLLAIVFWKGEPQSMRDNSSP